MADIEYWIIGGTFALCGASFFFVVVPLYAWRHVGAGKRPPLPVGQANTTGLHFVDVLGVGAFFGIYAGMWLATALAPEAVATEALTEETGPVMVLVGGLVMQAMMVVFALMMLVWRVNLVELFGLRYRQWWLPVVLAALITFLMFTFNALLSMAGYNEWITGLLGGEDGTQDAVKMMKGADDPLTVTLMVLMACIGAPLSEEIVFRGYIYGAVKKMGGIVFSMVFSALFFSVVHMNLASLLPLFVLGLALAAVYELTGTLWAPIAVHFLFNSVSTFFIHLQRVRPDLFQEALVP
jgi:membrane protease YdiL (CAAX protease family)